MTIYDTQHPIFFATLFQSYFSGADSVAAGCPDADTLPLRIMDVALKPPLPSGVVVAMENGSRGAHRIMNISVQVFNGIKAASEAAADVEWQTALTTVSGWLAPMERRVRQMADADDDGTLILGWRSWLLAQTADEKTGWRALKFVYSGMATPKRRDETTLIHSFAFDLHYALV